MKKYQVNSEHVKIQVNYQHATIKSHQIGHCMSRLNHDINFCLTLEGILKISGVPLS